VRSCWETPRSWSAWPR